MKAIAGPRRIRSKRQVVSEFRRKEILNAARKVFARRGFSAGIVDAIAQEAGIAKGTIYLYFKSKKAIYQSLLQHDMEALRSAMLERMNAATSLREKIREFACARLEHAEANREFFRIMDLQPAGLAITRNQYREWLLEPVNCLARAIEQASREGKIRSVPAEKTAWAAADLSRGCIQRRLLTADESPISQDADFITGLLCAFLQLRSSAGNSRKNPRGNGD